MSGTYPERSGLGEKLLRVSWQGLCKAYGAQRFLSGLSGSAAAPGNYGLTGKSGSGKTTFFRLLMGLEAPDEGMFRWERLDPVTGKTEQLAGMPRAAVVFQENRLCEAFTAEENIRLILQRGVLSGEEIRRELLAVLPEECLAKPTGKLSGGQKRRVAIVRAMIAPETDYIVLDEPFTGLDGETKERVIAYVRERKRDRLLFIAAHEREELEAFSIQEENYIMLGGGVTGTVV